MTLDQLSSIFYDVKKTIVKHNLESSDTYFTTTVDSYHIHGLTNIIKHNSPFSFNHPSMDDDDNTILLPPVSTFNPEGTDYLQYLLQVYLD